jgi:hypothetical protein
MRREARWKHCAKLPAAELLGQCAQQFSPRLSGMSNQTRATRRPRRPAIFISLEALLPFALRDRATASAGNAVKGSLPRS